MERFQGCVIADSSGALRASRVRRCQSCGAGCGSGAVHAYVTYIESMHGESMDGEHGELSQDPESHVGRRALRRSQPQAKLTWLCILTGPLHHRPPGLSVCEVASLAEAIRHGIDTVSKALPRTLRRGAREGQPRGRVIPRLAPRSTTRAPTSRCSRVVVPVEERPLIAPRIRLPSALARCAGLLRRVVCDRVRAERSINGIIGTLSIRYRYDIELSNSIRNRNSTPSRCRGADLGETTPRSVPTFKKFPEAEREAGRGERQPSHGRHPRSP